MLNLLVGEAGYRAALDLYFDRHDGQACTIEDWLKVFEDATGRDLGQFKLWYEQAGTPRLSVTEEWDGETFRLTFAQHLPPTPGQSNKAPQVIPVAMGLIGADGTEVAPTQVLALDRAQVSVAFKGLKARPVASLLRGGSAPVVLDHRPRPGDLAHLMAHDTDPVARWDAGHRLALEALAAMVVDGTDPGAEPVAGWIAARAPFLHENGLDPSYRALMLGLPGDEVIAAHLARLGHVPDPDRIHAARGAALDAIAQRFAEALRELVATHAATAPFSPDPASAGRRALWGAGLGLLTRLDGGRAARAAFAASDNMTDTLAALGALARIGQGAAEFEDFHVRWQGERLVIDQWFTLQAATAAPESALATVERLAAHPAFDWTNPNRFRALIGGFAGNHAGFHRADGSGYAWLADWLIRLDGRNPQFAARMSTAFESWRVEPEHGRDDRPDAGLTTWPRGGRAIDGASGRPVDGPSARLVRGGGPWHRRGSQARRG